MSDRPKLPRWITVLIHIDVFILIKVFLKPTWWVDRRWHINQYDLAGQMMCIALAACLADNALSLVTSHWTVGAVGTFASIGMTWLYSFSLKRLARASRDYERDPSVMTQAQIPFHYHNVPPGRLLLLLVGLEMCLALIPLVMNWTLFIRAFLAFWMLLLGGSLYVAGVPHTPFQRRKKKEKAQAPLLAPAPLGSPT